MWEPRISDSRPAWSVVTPHSISRHRQILSPKTFPKGMPKHPKFMFVLWESFKLTLTELIKKQKKHVRSKLVSKLVGFSSLS